MASCSNSSVAFYGANASNFLRSSRNGVSGVSLEFLDKPFFGVRKNFTVSAKSKKGKKYEYPWTSDPDPNVEGGVLFHLSHFKPSKEKPKPVTLDFEKPLQDLVKKINKVRKMAQKTGLDFSEQIISLENKYQEVLKDLYQHLTPIQRLNIARHPNRPTFLDHVLSITDKWVELHGDRAGYDDPAIVTGIGTIDGRAYVFIGHQKGRNTKENIQRNFGMPTPHGYRKALRMMYYADHHQFPIITFIDTPGAFADLKSEELGQGEAIAHNLRTMFGLKVPIVSVVIGEGGSGGALAIGCANKLLMLENAVFYVASPEVCAAVLWKSAKASPKAAEKLKITAAELCKLKVADGIIPEPLGGAHADPYWISQQIKIAVVEAMDELLKMNTQELLNHRMLKFRILGGFQEGISVDAQKKVNMKKGDPSILQKGRTGRTPNLELEDEVEKLKNDVLKAKESYTELPELNINEMIQKLENEVNQEFSVAVKALGLEDKFEMLREEFTKARSIPDQLMNIDFKDKVEKLKQEFHQSLPQAPNYASLNEKLGMLKDVSDIKKTSEQNNLKASLKQEINKSFKEVMDRSDLKEKIEKIKGDMASSVLSSEKDADFGLKERIMNVKKEIELELADALKSLKFDVVAVQSKAKDSSEQTPFSDLRVKVDELNEEIRKEIEDIVTKTPNLKNKIDQLKLAVAMERKIPEKELKDKLEDLNQQIKQGLSEATSPLLVEKHYKLKAEIAKAIESFEGLDGSSI